MRRLAIVAAALAALAEVHAGQKWVRAATDDVCILSDASPKIVSEYVVKYTAFRQAFIALLAPPGHRPPPVILVLFRNESELMDCVAKPAGREHTVAFSTEVDGSALLALVGSGDRETALSLAFEFDTLWSLRRVGYILPLWMGQGTGEVFASLRISKGQCIIDGNLERVDGTWRHATNIPWERFFRIYEGSKEYRGPEATGMYQAQAWALMNLVLLPGGKPREQLVRLAEKVQESYQDLAATEAVLGIPAAKFDAAIDRQLRSDLKLVVPFDESGILARLKIEPADEVEVNVRLGDLLLANGRTTEGDVAVNRAAALAPTAVFVQEAHARRALRENDQEEAARFYRAAIAAGSVDTNAYLFSASERLDRSQAYGADFAGGGGKNVDDALEEIHRALELNPGDLRAWQLLGRAYFVAKEPSAEGAVELGRAITGDADSQQVRYYRGLLYTRLEKTVEARADYEQVARDPRTPAGLRTIAKSHLLEMTRAEDQREIERLVHEEKYADARAIIAHGLELATGTPALTRYEFFRDWVNENESWAKVVAAYNRHEWAAASAAATAFLMDYPKSALGADARRLKASADGNAKH